VIFVDEIEDKFDLLTVQFFVDLFKQLLESKV
jgi:hypothetical protein